MTSKGSVITQCALAFLIEIMMSNTNENVMPAEMATLIIG